MPCRARRGATCGPIPVAAALDDTIVQFRLPRQALVDLIDARVFDLYDDPMPSLNDLEGYCGETSSSLIRLSSIILADGANPGTADAAGHAGVAYAITGLLRAFPHGMRARGRSTFRPIFWPGTASCATTSSPGAAGRASRARWPICAPSPAGIWSRCARCGPRFPTAAKPAFRPLALVEPYLKAMERRDYDPFHTVVDMPAMAADLGAVARAVLGRSHALRRHPGAA